MRRRKYRTLASLTVLSLLGQPLFSMAEPLVYATTIDGTVATETTAPVNLALFKTAEATSQYDGGGVKASAVDGDPKTFWRSKSTDAAPALWVDLGEKTAFNTIELMLYVKSDAAMTSFTVEYSDDLDNWSVLDTQSEGLTDKQTVTLSFPTVEARYVRFAHESTGSTSNGVYELAVYNLLDGSNPGTEEPAPDPNPEPVDPGDGSKPPVEETEEPAEEEAEEVRENIALNKPTEHSTQWGSGGRSTWAFDGDYATFWRNLSSDGIAPWVIVDLGEDAVFDGVHLQLYARHTMNNFALEYSNDKINWSSLASESDASQLVDGAEFDYDFDYVQARYLRFTHELGALKNTNGLYELEIYKAHVPVESVTLNRSTMSLLAGHSLALNSTVLPSFAEQSLNWTSSDESVATVDAQGVVTAVAPGEAVIRAVSVQHEGTGVPAGHLFDEVAVSVLAESTSAKDLLSFEVEGQAAEIDQEKQLVSIELPFSVDLTQVVPTFTSSGSAVGVNGQLLQSGETALDLSQPISLEVYGEDGIVQNYTVEPVIVSSGQDVAFGKAASTNQYRADNPPEWAVDGNPGTPFKSIIAEYNTDITDPPASWITLDLGNKHTFDRATLDLYNSFNIARYHIQISDDGENWADVVTHEAEMVEGDSWPEGDIEQQQMHVFAAPVTARYVRYWQKLIPNGADLVGGVNDFGLFLGEPSPTVTQALLVVDGQEIETKADIELPVGESRQIGVKGILSNGETIELPLEAVRLTQRSKEGGDSLILGEGGIITAIDYGITRLSAEITHEGKTRTFDFFVDTFDYETVVMDVELEANGETFQIGYPSFVNQYEEAPVLNVLPYFDGTISATIEREGVPVEGGFTAQAVTAHERTQLPLNLRTVRTGQYQVTVNYQREGKADHVESFYFAVVNADTKAENESYVAYVGEDGKLVYTPDFRGNTIIDYSHAGYKGADSPVPTPAELPATVTVAPIEGDNTAHIQAAIDQVAALSRDEDGFRGVIELAPGTFRIEGTLNLNADGIVLRGSGQGEGETLLLDTGGQRDYMLKVGGGQTTETDVKAAITDVYVPTGGRTFTVADASQFTVGDSIFVKRHSNDRWIHEIYMDDIPEKSGTKQWTPFTLSFDRTITAVDGNTITIDAPINNAIELRWGGGEIVKYEDTRVQNIGVENLRVDVEVDWKEATTKVDRYGFQYSTDAGQAKSFADLRNVKNAWFSDVTGYHQIYALVNVANSSKWITVQDSSVYEMNGEITGGNRYAFNTDGQMVLMKGLHVETARHSFTIQSRVAGPNVYLDSTALYEMTNSEPHQRYSVGGLFDNIHGTVNIQDRGNMGTGHGWAGANYVAWNTEGYIRVESPPTAMNYAIGAMGDANRTDKDGYWDNFGAHVNPRSLYVKQWEDRLGADMPEAGKVQAVFNGTSSVAVSDAYTLTYGVDSLDNYAEQIVQIGYDAEAFAFEKVEAINGYSKITNVDTSKPGYVRFTITNKRQNQKVGKQDKLVDIEFEAIKAVGHTGFWLEEAEMTGNETGEGYLGRSAEFAVEVTAD